MSAGGGAANLASLLRAVKNVQHLNGLFVDAVRGDKGQTRKHKLTRTFLAARSPSMRRIFKGTNGLVEFKNGRVRQFRMVLGKVILDVLEIFCGCKCPPDAHWECASGLKHALDSRVHLFFFHELPAVGLLKALTDTRSKAGIVFQQAQSGVLHQLLGIDPFARSDFR